MMTAAGIPKGEIKFIILLDSGSSVTIIMNADLVTNIRTVKESIKLITNAGEMIVNQKATLKGYPIEVWFCPKAKVNCLSFSEAKDLGFKMGYNDQKDTFGMLNAVTHIGTLFPRMGNIYAMDSRVKEFASERLEYRMKEVNEMPALDGEEELVLPQVRKKVSFQDEKSAPDEGSIGASEGAQPTANDTVEGIKPIPTVEGNKKMFSKKENSRAEVCRALHACINYPTIAAFKHIIRTNQIKGCPVTTADVDLMLQIYGPSIIGY